MKNRLGLVLLAQGVHQNEIARQINVTASTMHHYVKGLRMPSVEMALKIAKALGVKVEDNWEV